MSNVVVIEAIMQICKWKTHRRENMCLYINDGSGESAKCYFPYPSLVPAPPDLIAIDTMSIPET